MYRRGLFVARRESLGKPGALKPLASPIMWNHCDLAQRPSLRAAADSVSEGARADTDALTERMSKIEAAHVNFRNEVAGATSRAPCSNRRRPVCSSYRRARGGPFERPKA